MVVSLNSIELVKKFAEIVLKSEKRVIEWTQVRLWDCSVWI